MGAPQRVLVLGADAHVGRQVVTALAGCGWAQPLAASRRGTAAPSASRLALDPTDRPRLVRALDGVDSVVNCVGGEPATLRAVADALFDAAGRAGTPRVVHLSGMDVYGAATGEVTEAAPLRHEREPRAAAQVAAEQRAARYPRSVRLRPGCIYGPGSAQWSGRIARWLQARRLGDLGPDGDGYCNLVHVDDVVRAVLETLRHPAVEGEVFNLATPEPPTWNEYFLRYAKALGAVPARRVPRGWLTLETRLFAAPLRVGEALGRALHLGRWPLPLPISERLLKLWRQEIRVSPRKAETVLGLQWKPLDAGLRETAEWYR